jgi:hypothetical protein
MVSHVERTAKYVVRKVHLVTYREGSTTTARDFSEAFAKVPAAAKLTGVVDKPDGVVFEFSIDEES